MFRRQLQWLESRMNYCHWDKRKLCHWYNYWIYAWIVIVHGSTTINWRLEFGFWKSYYEPILFSILKSTKALFWMEFETMKVTMSIWITWDFLTYNWEVYGCEADCTSDICTSLDATTEIRAWSVVERQKLKCYYSTLVKLLRTKLIDFNCGQVMFVKLLLITILSNSQVW